MIKPSVPHEEGFKERLKNPEFAYTYVKLLTRQRDMLERVVKHCAKNRTNYNNDECVEALFDCMHMSRKALKELDE